MMHIIYSIILRRWSLGDSAPPGPKSMGAMVMTCDVITECWGPLRYSDEVWEEKKKEKAVQDEIARTSEEQARRGGSILNPQKDGYYESTKFLKVDTSGGRIFIVT